MYSIVIAGYHACELNNYFSKHGYTLELTVSPAIGTEQYKPRIRAFRPDTDDSIVYFVEIGEDASLFISAKDPSEGSKSQTDTDLLEEIALALIDAGVCVYKTR